MKIMKGKLKDLGSEAKRKPSYVDHQVTRSPASWGGKDKLERLLYKYPDLSPREKAILHNFLKVNAPDRTQKMDHASGLPEGELGKISPGRSGRNRRY